MKNFSIKLTLVVIIGFLIAASLGSLSFAFLRDDALPLTLVAAANIVAVISLTFLITRGIMSPLSQIKDIMKKVGEGELTSRVDLRATKEMEEIGEVLNDMVWRLHVAREEAKDTNKILEHRVRQRTQELQELTTSLEEKVAARTKELQENVQELERFQKLAVGRELKMIELKDEIKRLERQVMSSTEYAPRTAGQRKTQRT